jgi:hypothetical protein
VRRRWAPQLLKELEFEPRSLSVVVGVELTQKLALGDMEAAFAQARQRRKHVRIRALDCATTFYGGYTWRLRFQWVPAGDGAYTLGAAMCFDLHDYSAAFARAIFSIEILGQDGRCAGCRSTGVLTHTGTGRVDALGVRLKEWDVGALHTWTDAAGQLAFTLKASLVHPLRGAHPQVRR